MSLIMPGSRVRVPPFPPIFPGTCDVPDDLKRRGPSDLCQAEQDLQVADRGEVDKRRQRQQHHAQGRAFRRRHPLRCSAKGENQYDVLRSAGALSGRQTKSTRQQRSNCELRNTAAQVGLDDNQVRAAEFEHHLAATATGCNRPLGVPYYCQVCEVSGLASARYGRKQGNAFCTDAQTVRSVLNVAPAEHSTAARKHCGAHSESRIGGVSPIASLARHAN